MPSKRGPYELKARADRQRQTRERLVAAAADLHGEVGPAFTSMADVAERAGVSRMTAYRHFPTEVDLFRACGSHFISGHPPPSVEPWLKITDPLDRLRQALAGIYAYYRRHQQRIANVLRDSQTMPVGGAFRDAERGWTEALLEAWGASIRRRKPMRGAIALAVHFETWRHLSQHERLRDAEIIELMHDAAQIASSRR
jgi:AcrR family transcriptional regulator